MTTYEYAKKVVAEYDPEHYGRATLTLHPDQQSWQLELATGGWSDNEDFLHELASFSSQRHSGWMWWSLCWQSTHRGGLFRFEGRCDQELYVR